MKRIYLDNNSTTKPDQSLYEKQGLWSGLWGNPSSVHKEGRESKALIRKAREQVASVLKAKPQEITFSSGGSESNNHVIKGVFEFFRTSNPSRNRYIFSSVEHPSVSYLKQWLTDQGAQVITVAVNQDGELDESDYEKVLDDSVALVSMMYVNNETGCIFPIKTLCQKAHEKGALFHCDMVQALGKIDCDMKDLGVDFATFSAHKFYAFKGAGALYMSSQTRLSPLILGGGQEKKTRAGTENIFSIAAFGEICAEKGSSILESNKKVEALRNYMEDEFCKMEGVFVIGKKSPRVSNTSGVFIEGVYGESLVMSMDMKGFSLSFGSACSSGSVSLSPVLSSMGFSEKQIKSSLRVSLSWETTKEDIELFCKTLNEEIVRLRNLKK